MPELPEVEIVRQSLNKKIKNKKVKKVIVRNRNLRFKVPKEFVSFFKNLENSLGILNLKFLFLIITFMTLFCLIFLFSDCLTISTSGNSGI